jgi:Undecaprenyl-phosphate glucose phosphotransferase
MVRRLNVYRFALRLICFMLPLIAFTIAWMIRFSNLLGTYWTVVDYDPYPYFQLLILTTIVWAIAAESYGVSSFENLWRENTGARAALAASTMTAVIVLTAVFFYRTTSFSRAFTLISALILLTLTLLVRAVFRTVLRHANGYNAVRVIVVGADKFARSMVQRLNRSHYATFQVASYVRIPGQQAVADAQPLVELDDLDQLVVDHPVDEIVIAVEPAGFSNLDSLVVQLERLCFPIRLAVDLGARIELHDRLLQFGRVRMLDLSTSPTDSVPYTLLKRAFDISFSFIAISLLAPVMVVIALAIKLTSSGPVLFVQERVGLNGRLFRMYKFRTMMHSEKAVSDRQWTVAADPRRTGVGIFLRKYNLDELPQFFNVLKGDMSVVGPRPERPHFARRFHDEVARYSSRHKLRVGITGWAQVNGWRGDTSISKRIEYDRYYLRHWSMAFDMQIILLTLVSPLARRNAY